MNSNYHEIEAAFNKYLHDIKPQGSLTKPLVILYIVNEKI
jgi:hypothetical protein